MRKQDFTNKKIKGDALRAGVDPVDAPLTFLNTFTNQFEGIDIDILKLIAKYLNIEIQYFPMIKANILIGLSNDMLDLTFATINKERKMHYDFSKPIRQDYYSLIFNKNHPMSDEEFLSNKNKNIAVKRGSSMEAWCQNNVKHNLIILDDSNQAIEQLKSGSVDGVLETKVKAKYIFKENKELDINIIEASKSYNAIMMHKGNQELLNKINRAIDELNKTGEIQRLVLSYFGEDSVIQ